MTTQFDYIIHRKFIQNHVILFFQSFPHKSEFIWRQRQQCLPGWEGDLTDRSQGVDVLAQLVKLFSWAAEHASIFLF